MRIRRHMVMVAATVGLLLVGAATAWACTTSAHISITQVLEAPSPGQQVSVTGRDFVAGGPVQVYWQPANGDGDRELLFETTGSRFARPLTIPADAGEGTHLVVAEGYEPGDNEPVGRAAATVQIAGAEADSAGAAPSGGGELWSGADGSPSLSAADDASAGQTGVGRQLAVAAGLFAAGGLVLGGGTVAALRRRRALAVAARPSD